MKKRTKKFLMLSAIILSLLAMFPFNINAASKTKLSETKKTISLGDTTTIKILNNKKNVKWYVSNKSIKIVSKNNKQAKIKGVKKGISYLNAKIGKNTYKCKITVKDAKLPHGKDIGQGEMYIYLPPEGLAKTGRYQRCFLGKI